MKNALWAKITLFFHACIIFAYRVYPAHIDVCILQQRQHILYDLLIV